MRINNSAAYYLKPQKKPTQSLILSKPIKVPFPKSSHLRQNIFSSLMQIIKKPGNAEQVNKKLIIPVQTEMIILACGNKLALYNYISDHQYQIKFELLSQLQLNYYIGNIKLSHFERYRKNKAFNLIVKDSTRKTVELLQYDPGPKIIKRLNLVRLQSPINCWAFIQNNELVVWCQNLNIYHYEVKGFTISLVQVVKTNINVQEIPGQKEGSYRSHSKDNNSTISKNSNNLNRTKSVSTSKLQSLKSFKKDTVNSGVFVDSKPELKDSYELGSSYIVGHRQKNQDNLIFLFYMVHNKKRNKTKLKMREIHYPLQNQQSSSPNLNLKDISQYPKMKMLPETYQIQFNEVNQQFYLQPMNIIKMNDVFILRFQFQFIIIKKNYTQFLVLDTLSNKSKNNRIVMTENSNFTISNFYHFLQINQMHVNQNKVSLSLFDFIDLEPVLNLSMNSIKEQQIKERQELKRLQKQADKNYYQIGKNQVTPKTKPIKKTSQQLAKHYYDIFQMSNNKNKLIMMWVSTETCNQCSRNSMYFVFQKIQKINGQQKSQHVLYKTIISPKQKKLCLLGQKCKSSEELEGIQRYGKDLGVDKTRFYYNMWRNSEKKINQIIFYLLKCNDYTLILSQIKGFLRKKNYAATRINKIIQRLQTLALNILKQNLNEQNFMNYFHSIFIHRKFMIYDANYQINQTQFKILLDQSLYDLVYKIIQLKINPQITKPELWKEASKQPPKLSMIQVLNYFKISLLQEYDKFLNRILLEYSNDIIRVIQAFPELLPEYPFELQKIIKEKKSTQKQVKANKQNQFFSSIIYEDILKCPNFISNIEKQLSQFYPTSAIRKKIEQTLNRKDMKDQKFISHIIILSSFEQYQKNLENITGLKLYVITLNRLIISCFKNNINAFESIQKLCKFYNKEYNLIHKAAQQLRIQASIFYLMLRQNIIQHQKVTMQTIIRQPIQKWIALFFLGNKLNKHIIFNQFMQIFKDKNQFVSTIQNYIKSQNCSIVQINFLAGLVANQSHQFQMQNPQVIQVIINGFCSKVSIEEIPQAKFFKGSLKNIPMQKKIISKLDKIEKARLCKLIFYHFELKNILISDLFQTPFKILEQLIQCFFQQRVKEPVIFLKEQRVQFKINSLANMFQFLCYLRENIFIDISAFDFLYFYVRKLVEWREFDQIHKQITKQNKNYFLANGVSVYELVSKIQNDILQILYTDKELQYDDQTKDYLNQLLNLSNHQKCKNKLVVQEKARMKLAQIFFEWGQKKKLIQIHQLAKKWQQHELEANKVLRIGGVFLRPVMLCLIQQYDTKLTLKYLSEIYDQFITISSGKVPTAQRSDQYYHYCIKLFDNFLALERCRQACEILFVINQRFQMNYLFMSQCLLKSLKYLYIDKKENSSINLQIFNIKSSSKSLIQNQEKNEQIYKDIEISQVISEENSKSQDNLDKYIKKYIDHFVYYWFDDQEEKIKKLFYNFFPKNLKQDPSIGQIQICQSLCFKFHYYKMSTNLLWTITQKIFKQIQGEKYEQNKQKMIYCYFFIQMGLFYPEEGFANISFISYNHSSIVSFLQKLKQSCDKPDDVLYFLDYTKIFELYLNSLTQLFVNKFQSITKESEKKQKKQNKQKKQKKQSKQKKQKKQKKMDEKSPKQNQAKDKNEKNQLKANLEVVREQIKKGHYKKIPQLLQLSDSINRLSSITSQTQKNSNKNFRQKTYKKIFESKSDVGLKKNTKVRKNRNQKNLLNSLKEEVKNQQNKQQKIGVKLTYRQYQQLKNITIMKKSSESKNLNISQLDIMNQIFQKQESRTMVDQFINYYKQIEQQMKRQQSLNDIYYNDDESKETIEQSIEHRQIIQAIKNKKYQLIENWSRDAILLETKKIYNSDIKFLDVLEMFQQYGVGNQKKVQALTQMLKQQFDISDRVLKQVFDLDYIISEFGDEQSHRRNILQNITKLVQELSVFEIKQLSFCIHKIVSYKYKSEQRQQLWINQLAIIAIYKQIYVKSKREEKLDKIRSLIRIIQVQYFKKTQKDICDLFEEQMGYDAQFRKSVANFIEEYLDQYN